MTFSEQISRQFLNTFSMTTYLTIFLIILALVIICLILNERYRFRITIAEKKLEQYNNISAYKSDNAEFFSKEEIEILKKTSKRKIPSYIISIITYIITICMALGIYILLDTYIIARQHGYYSSFSTNAEKLWDSINLSPKMSKLPDDYTNKIIICYRFGCADCEATYTELSNLLSDRNDVYWVSTRSNIGEELVETYNIKEVPTGLFITDDNYFTYQLYIDLFNKTEVDTTAVENLITTANYYEEKGD